MRVGQREEDVALGHAVSSSSCFSLCRAFFFFFFFFFFFSPPPPPPRWPTPTQRGQIVRRSAPRWLLPTPTAELGKTERDPILTIGPSIQYVTESGDPVGKIKLLSAAC